MKRDGALYSIAFMALLAAVFGFLTSSINEATRERVATAERQRLQGHVLSALGLYAGGETAPEVVALDKLWNTRISEVDSSAEGEKPFYTGKDDAGKVLGHALPFKGPGFWGPIEGYLGVDVRGERLLGISFTSQSETPGLGARITEGWFREQFAGKRVGVLAFVKGGASGAGEVDAITGATETVSRMERFLNELMAGLGAHPAFSAAGREGGG